MDQEQNQTQEAPAGDEAAEASKGKSGWGYAASRRLKAETVSAQGGKRKPRGFWNIDGPAMPVLLEFAAGEITLEEASAKLNVSPTYEGADPPVVWYAKRYGLIEAPAKAAKDAKAQAEVAELAAAE